MRGLVLLTGATGFVGPTAARALAQAGHSVRATLRRPAAIPGVSESTSTADLAAESDLGRFVSGCQSVVHLAARVHVMHDTAASPLAEFRKANRDVTLRLAEAAAAAGVRRFIYLSTIKVLGEGSAGAPLSESGPAAPVDPYGISKWEAEQGLWEIARRTGLEVVVVRPPLVHGPGAKGNLARLLRWVDRGLPLPLGAAHNRRTMVGVDNLADLIVRALAHTAAAGRTLHATDERAVSTAELIHLLARGMGRPVRLIPVPTALLRLGGLLTARMAEVDRLVGSLEVDAAETWRALDWTPPVPLEEGLARMARAYRDTH